MPGTENNAHGPSPTRYEVKAKVVSAFPAAAMRRLDHEQCVEMCSHLSRPTMDDLITVLPLVLIDLLDHHGDMLRGCGDMVVQMLNVECSESPAMREWFEKTFSQAAVENMRRSSEWMREDNLETFGPFTKEQADAIYSWLLVARNWLDLNSYQDNIAASLLHWGRKAGRVPGG